MGNKKKASRGIGKGTRSKKAPSQQKSSNPYQVSLGISAPVVMSRLLGPTNSLSVRQVTDPELGPGISISGTEQLCKIGSYSSAGTSGLIQVPGFGSGSFPIYAMMLSPGAQIVYQGGSTTSDLAVTGISYTFYRFRSLRFRYVPSCATSTAVNLTIGYSPDVRVIVPTDSADFSVPTPAIVSKLRFSIETQAWQAAEINLPVVPRMGPAYYCDTDPITLAGSTTTLTGILTAPSLCDCIHNFQGVFLAITDTAAATASYGKILMDYTTDFFSRGTIQLAAGS